MELVRLIVPSEASRDTVACLGDVGLVQFRDLNHAKPFPQRAYATRVKRCDEMLRRLRFFAAAFKDAGIAPRAMPSPETSIDFDDLETRLTEAESETRTSVGAVARALAAQRGVLGPRLDGVRGDEIAARDARRVRRVGGGNDRGADAYGEPQRVFARAQVALGRVPEQVLQWRRICTRSIRFRSRVS